jgi:hypothetical protein
VKRTTKSIRGGPVYVKAGDTIISLVPEVKEVRFAGRSMGVLRLSAIFVIDERGVERKALTGQMGATSSILSNLVLGPLQWWLLVGRKRSRR